MNDIESLFFYLFCFGVSAMLFHVGQRRKLRTPTIAAILIPTLVGGFRYRVGVDYVSYMSKLMAAPKSGLAEFSSKFGGMEPALWLFGQLPWQVFFFATSFLIIFFFYLGFKNFKSKHIGLSASTWRGKAGRCDGDLFLRILLYPKTTICNLRNYYPMRSSFSLLVASYALVIAALLSSSAKIGN